MRNAILKYLTWKTRFLLAITSARRASELRALCYKEPYLAMSLAGDFRLKVNSQFHVTQPIEVLAMHEVQPGLHLLCVMQALKFYLLRTAGFRDCDDIQLFLAFGGVTKGKPISKQRISKWLVETVKCAYAAHDLEAPQGSKAIKPGNRPSPLPRWLALIHSSFVRLLLGPHRVLLLNTTISISWPKLDQTSAGEC